MTCPPVPFSPAPFSSDPTRFLATAAQLARAGLSVLISALITFAAFSPAAAALVSRCQAIADAAPHDARPSIVRVGLTPARLEPYQAQLTFIGHATFLLESAAGVRIATDYNDVFRPATTPDIVTMNQAHTTHHTSFPDPAIKHVLRGWNPDGGAAQHQLELKDVLVRNVPTNIRSYGTEVGKYGNSIFIFETAGLCIGHLGHLHHTLNPSQIAAIGQLDVVMVPVDGGYTLDLPGMIEVLNALRARLIIPMHYFNSYGLDRFTSRIKQDFPVETAASSTITLSRAMLPPRPTVMILPGH